MSWKGSSACCPSFTWSLSVSLPGLFNLRVNCPVPLVRKMLRFLYGFQLRWKYQVWKPRGSSRRRATGTYYLLVCVLYGNIVRTLALAGIKSVTLVTCLVFQLMASQHHNWRPWRSTTEAFTPPSLLCQCRGWYREDAKIASVDAPALEDCLDLDQLQGDHSSQHCALSHNFGASLVCGAVLRYVTCYTQVQWVKQWTQVQWSSVARCGFPIPC